MKLESLVIQRLPGIREPIRVESPDPSLNLVVGPNASGKSSLVRALRYLLAGPAPGDPLELVLEAEFSSGDRRWQVVRSGSMVQWTRDGRPADPPPLPDPRFLHCYWLSVEDLLLVGQDGARRGGAGAAGPGAPADDSEMLARIRRELGGGYDLPALLRAPPFQVGARHGRGTANELRKARERADSVLREYRDLQEQRERLPELERRIRASAGVEARIARLDQALELLEARREHRGAEAAIHAFPAPPEAMRLLRGDEQDRIEKLEERRRALEVERTQSLRAQAEARALLDASGLAEDRPGREDLERERHTLQEARQLLPSREAVLKEDANAAANERGALEELGADPEVLPRLDPESISEADTLAEEIARVRTALHGLDERLAEASPGPEPGLLDRHREGIEALRSWLSPSATSAPSTPTWPTSAWLPGLLVLGGALAVVAEGVLGTPWAGSLGALLALIGTLWLAFLAWDLRRERTRARDRYLRTGLAPLPTWTTPEISRRLSELEGELARLRETESAARKVEEDRARSERLRSELADLELRKERLAREVGFDPERTALSLHRFVGLVDRLGSARRDRIAAELRREGLEARFEEHASEITGFLERWGELPDPLPAPLELRAGALHAALTRLEGRRADAVDALRSLEEATRELARIERDMTRLATDEEGLLREAGLTPAERTELGQRLERLPEFRTLEQALQAAAIREATLRAAVEGDAELLARVEDDDEEGLHALREELRAQGETAAEDTRTRADLEADLKRAGTDHRLEEKRAEADEIRGRLEEELEAALLAEAGSFLLGEVQEEHRTEHEPGVLRDARERFERFTHHAWSLELGDDTGRGDSAEWMARDLRSDELRRLAQLSSGTRMQLLLAVRVAWARKVEDDREPLPFVLDEALTTSDPDRFRQVAESLAALAADEDRQLFYLSAHPGDLQLWERALGRQPHLIPFGTVRPEAGWDRTWGRFVLSERTPIPAPAGDTPERYAVRLGVPPVDPWADPAGIPLFHLLRDDLERLHGLMDGRGIRALGPLETFLRDEGSSRVALPDSALREELAGRCQVARRWLEAWRTGRGRPVDRTVLERADAVSDTFLDRVAALADEVAGDPRALVLALQDLPRFQKSKIVELEEWLEEEGYLLPGEPLSPEEREARVLQDAAGILPPARIRACVEWLEAGVAGRDGGRA